MKKTPTAPEPHWLNKRDMARSCGVSTQGFDAWGVKPIAKIGREVFFAVEDVVRNRVERAERRLAVPKAPENPAVADELREKALLTRAQRESHELKNAQMRRELAPVAVIEWALARVGSQISALFDAIPLKVKRMLPKLQASEIEIMKRELIKAQNAAARVTVDLDEYYGRDGDRDRPSDSSRAEDAREA